MKLAKAAVSICDEECVELRAICFLFNFAVSGAIAEVKVCAKEKYIFSDVDGFPRLPLKKKKNIKNIILALIMQATLGIYN